jgi:hypothetical protein
LFGSRSVVTTAFGDVWNLGTVLFLIFESEVRASNTSRAIFPIPPFSPITCASAASPNGIRRPMDRTNVGTDCLAWIAQIAQLDPDAQLVMIGRDTTR